MPLVLVTGDDLPALFNRDGRDRFAHVGDGAIWLRAERPQDLPHLAVAVKQWRDGRAPDAVVLSVVPARYTDADLLTQSLRMIRQAVADAARMLGSGPLPGYIAMYQRLTTEPSDLATPAWYGVSSLQRLTGADGFESVIRAAEGEVEQTANASTAAARAAALASIVGWTQRVVVQVLTDRQQADWNVRSRFAERGQYDGALAACSPKDSRAVVNEHYGRRDNHAGEHPGHAWTRLRHEPSDGESQRAGQHDHQAERVA